MNFSRSRALTGIALAVAGAVVFTAARTAAVEAVYPVEKAKRTFTEKVLSRLSGMLRGAEARAENIRLRREVATLSLVRTDNERLEAENARLRAALGYSRSRSGEWLAAAVLSSEGGAVGSRGIVRVDKGSLDGVAEGAVVVVPEGLVGRVTDVTPHTSEITLITDPSVKVACEIAETGGVLLRGIIAGGSEDVLSLLYTVGGGNVPPRSRVTTSGVGGVFPKGLEIGTFISDGEVLPSVDFSNLEDVFIRREK